MIPVRSRREVVIIYPDIYIYIYTVHNTLIIHGSSGENVGFPTCQPTWIGLDYQDYTTHKHDLVGGFNHLEKYEFLNGKDYPIYYGK